MSVIIIAIIVTRAVGSGKDRLEIVETMTKMLSGNADARNG